VIEEQSGGGFYWFGDTKLGGCSTGSGDRSCGVEGTG